MKVLPYLFPANVFRVVVCLLMCKNVRGRGSEGEPNQIANKNKTTEVLISLRFRQ